MALYVRFNDSDFDPTFTLASEAFLVDSDSDSGENPCAVAQMNSEVSVLPTTSDEIVAYADIMGWTVTTDTDGRIVLHTGVAR